MKHDLGSSECKRDGACGGGGSVSLPGGTVVKGNGSVPCCFTENVIPPHDHLVPGKLKILHDEEVRGYTVFRKCVAPFTFLFFDIGKWSCEMEQIVYVGTYHVYTLGPCDDSGKSDSAPGD